MKAAVYDRVGPAREVLRIEDVPTPTPGPGEVRVKIAWSGVNPSDVKTRAGRRAKEPPFPLVIPHSDGAGTIDAVGPGVGDARIGQRVWTWNAAWGRPFGTAAEYVVLPQAQVVPLPDGVDLAIGACLGIPALTAYQALAMDGGVAGKCVLIPGGAGAVGHYAIQLARILGATQIISTASTADKVYVARQAGADLVLNYKTDDVAARVLEATGGEGVDRILEVDFGGNVNLDLQVLRNHGEIVVYGSNTPEIAVPFFASISKNVRYLCFVVYSMPSELRERAIAHLTRLIADRELQHNVADRVPLAQIAVAHDMVENGRVIGNVVVGVDYDMTPLQR